MYFTCISSIDDLFIHLLFDFCPPPLSPLLVPLFLPLYFTFLVFSSSSGLQLRHANTDNVFKHYSYTMAHPYSTAQPKLVDWYLLSSFHIESEHIRIHELREGDDLKEAIKNYQSAHTRAVIITNNKESQTLSKKWSASLEGFNNYLIIVLSSKEGSSLFEILDDDHEIHAKYGV